jgi:hypothetical protein
MSVIFNRIFAPWKGCNRSGLVHMTGTVTVGSSGAVSSSDTPGFTVTKQSAAGRYRVQLVASDGTTAAFGAQATTTAGVAQAPWAIQDPHANVVSTVADSAMTTDSALFSAIRNFTPLSGYFDVQFFKIGAAGTETHTDANIESGGVFFLAFDLKLSSASP